MSDAISTNIPFNQSVWAWLKRNYGYLLTALLCFSFLLHFYGDILLSPNDYMMSNTGDGLKNYYTLAYHLKHDSSIGHFGGMHYPYGDHVVYTDGQPFLGLILWVFPGAAAYSVGIINLMMLLSMLVSGLVIFRIFKVFKVHDIGGALAACSIAFLSPQVWRLGGHYSLAYAFVVPLAILWLIQAIQSQKLKYSIYLGILAFVFFYIHPYLAMMVVFIAGLAFFFQFLHHKTFKEWRAYLPMGIAALLPVILFTVVNMFFESHPNRPSEPNGFFQHHATVETIFVPNHPPLRHFMSQIIKVKNQPWEGWAYIGITVILCLLTFIFIGIFKSIKQKKGHNLLLPFPKPFGYLILAGFLLLLFSMCLPFRWGVEWWADYIGPAKQFRALGRFSWPFFYIMTIWSFIIINKHVKHKGVVLGLLITGATLNFIEGKEPHIVVEGLVKDHPNKFLNKHLTKDEQKAIDLIKQQDCVAMISLPFFHVGSEYFVRVGNEPSLFNTILYSYHTGLPSFNSWLGRSSIDETISINSLFTPHFLDKPIVDHLDLNQSVLIILHPGTKVDELTILDGAEELDQINGVTFFKNKLSNIFKKEHAEVLSHPLYQTINHEQKHTVKAVGGHPYFFEDFELSGNSTVAYQGETGYQGMKKDYHAFPIDSSLIDQDNGISVSFWFNCKEPLSTTGIMCYILEQGDDGFKKLHDPKGMTEIRYLDGDWGLVTLNAVIESKQHRLSLSIAGQEGNESLFFIDNLLFNGKQGVYYGKSGAVYFNNYPISQ